MGKKPARTARMLSAAVIVGVVIGTNIVSEPMQIASAFGVNIHEGITAEGLSERPVTFGFLRQAVFDDIVDQHEQIDSGMSGARDERHFDTCEFDGGVKYINDRYADASANLAARRLWDATDAFGLLLHPAQDLYAHSNWVELGFPTGAVVSRLDLIDLSRATASPGLNWRVPRTGGSVRGDILLGNDDLNIPAGWSIDRDGAGHHVPTMHNADGTRLGRLLMTGEGRLDDECDVFFPNATIAFDGFEHDDLNKDDESRPGYGKAYSLAMLQTAYEWCRLMAKAGATGTDGLLAALWVRSNGRPHPPGTPCEAAAPGRTEVTVVIDSVRVLDSGDDSNNQPGEVQLAVALYNHPSRFTRSVHGTNRNGHINVRNGQFIPASRLPEPLTLCANYDEQVTLAVHGWDNDDSSGDLFANDFDDKGDEEDEVLFGFQRRVGPHLPQGPQTATSTDLVVRYHFVPGGDQCDSGAPANDDFDGATTLSPASTGEVGGTNADASAEVGEPRHAGSAPDTSVWYRWRAPAPSGQTRKTAVFTTDGSTFNTTLVVYRGASLSSLSVVAANDNFNGADTSRVSFDPVPGATYHIAVNGVRGAAGSIRLRWGTGPPDDPTAP